MLGGREPEIAARRAPWPSTRCFRPQRTLVRASGSCEQLPLKPSPRAVWHLIWNTPILAGTAAQRADCSSDSTLAMRSANQVGTP